MDIKEGSIVVCANCSKEATVESIADYEGTIGYFLSCQHRNGYCRRCNELARDVSDSSNEVYVFCDNCFDDSQMYDPPEWEDSFNTKTNKHKKLSWKKPAPAYSLNSLKEVHSRAYDKWTEDECIALDLYLDKMNSRELSVLFNRQPSALGFGRRMESKTSIPNSSAIRFLGTKIRCNFCHHETLLSYRHLELIANKLEIKVINLHLGNITKMAESFKCKECGGKGATFSFDNLTR